MTVKSVGRICLNSALATSLAVSAALAVPLTAQADTVTFDLKDGTRDTGWSMSYDNSQVTVLSFSGLNDPTNKRLEGTLTFDKVFNDLKPIDIKFVESAAEIAKDDSFVLRINMFENITNQSGVAWQGYSMKLNDPSPLSGSDNSGHPGFAHFHPSPGPIFSPPFTLLTPNGGDKASTLQFGNGTFLDGATESWGNFGLHQYEDNNVDRSFTLTQSPTAVPTPSTFVMSSILLGLFGMVWSYNRLKQATTPG